MTPSVHFRFWRLSVEEMNIRLFILFISVSEEASVENDSVCSFSFLKIVRWGSEYPFVYPFYFCFWWSTRWKWLRLFIFVSEDCSLRKWISVCLPFSFPTLMKQPLKMTPLVHFRFWSIIRWGNEYPLRNPSFPFLMKQPLKMTPLVHFRF